MKSSIKFLDKIIQRQTSTTVMALEVGIILHNIHIPTTLVLVLLRVSTDRTTEVVQVRFDLLEFLQS